MSQKVFQLSALSQNDSWAADGSDIYCKVEVKHATLRDGSFPVGEDVKLPIPPGENPPFPVTPTWFAIPAGEAVYSVHVFCPTDKKYPNVEIAVSESEVKEMLKVPFEKRENVIYSKGEYGIIGFATEGADGPIYTITAGIYNPRLHGNN